MKTAGLIRPIYIAASPPRSPTGWPASPCRLVHRHNWTDCRASPGAPLPIGLYFIDTSSFGSRDITPTRHRLEHQSAVLHLGDTGRVVGGRLQLVVLQPITASSTRGAAYQSGFGQTLLAAQVAWKLGNNINFSYLLGAYLPSETKIVIQNTVLHQRFAITYNGDGWNLTGNSCNGTFFDTRSASGTFYPDSSTSTSRPPSIWQVGNRAGSLRIDRPSNQ